MIAGSSSYPIFHAVAPSTAVRAMRTRSAAVVLVVGDVLAPLGLGSLVAGDGFGDG
jgi:hypothetical protein